jgi:hypothetical protein
MQAIKLQVTVPKNRELILRLPESVYPGNVEVLILQGESDKAKKRPRATSESKNEINMQDLNIDEQQSADLRTKLSSFRDWDAPEMDIYNTYDASKAKL